MNRIKKALRTIKDVWNETKREQSKQSHYYTYEEEFELLLKRIKDEDICNKKMIPGFSVSIDELASYKKFEEFKSVYERLENLSELDQMLNWRYVFPGNFIKDKTAVLIKIIDSISNKISYGIRFFKAEDCLFLDEIDGKWEINYNLPDGYSYIVIDLQTIKEDFMVLMEKYNFMVKESVLEDIKLLKSIDENHIRKFPLILKRIYPSASIYYIEDLNHYTTKIGNDYYSVIGCVTECYKDEEKIFVPSVRFKEKISYN